MAEQTITGTLTAVTDDSFKGVAIKVYAITTADGTVVEAGEPASAHEKARVPVIDGKTVFIPDPRGRVGDTVTVTGRIRSDGRLHFYGEDWTVTAPATGHDAGDHSQCTSGRCPVAHAELITYQEGEPCRLADCDVCGRHDVPVASLGPQDRPMTSDHTRNAKFDERQQRLGY